MTFHAREESPSAKGNDGQEDTLGRRKEKEAPMRVKEERCCAHEPHKYSEDRIGTVAREWRKRARVRIREEVEGDDEQGHHRTRAAAPGIKAPCTWNGCASYAAICAGRGRRRGRA